MYDKCCNVYVAINPYSKYMFIDTEYRYILLLLVCVFGTILGIL